MNKPQDTEEPLHDRALLLLGYKRNEVLTLSEVQRYGSDSFSDPDYIRLYGMTPPQWYARGVRLLGRTAVECTRDPLADRIGRDVAAVAASLPPQTRYLVVDPFAGSCNTLYWILRHLPRSHGIAFEFDPKVYELTRRNIAGLDRAIELINGDYKSLLDGLDLPLSDAIIVFVAPPWGTALHEVEGLDLRRTEPPITDIITRVGQAYPHHRLLFAIQAYEKVNAESLTDLRTKVDWFTQKTYDLNVPGRNHGILLGTKGWQP
jgi:predicted RNA methylase